MNKLIFVYNADSGYFNLVVDIAHKIFSPATYPCSLCHLTHGTYKIRPAWEDFVKNAPIPLEFLHKDEFTLAYPEWSQTVLPLILAAKNGKLEMLIPATELNGLRSIADLKKIVLERVQGE